jgi:hypothetical protein
MQARTIILHRDDLYNQVWEVPMSRLAPKYGLSDVGLAKICKKLRIPRPPRGHWAKLRHGIKVSRELLPKLKVGEPCTYTLEVRQESDRVLKTVSEEHDSVISELESLSQVIVQERLSDPHPLIRETRDVLSKAKPNEYGVLRPLRSQYRDRCVAIRVSPGSVRRALRIMDALIKGLEAGGFQVSVDDGRESNTYALILGEKVHFSLNEKIRRKDHVPTEKERKEHERYSFNKWRPWDYIPTGKLSLCINEWALKKERKRWSDTSRKPLEKMLDEFVKRAVKIAHALHQERLEHEERIQQIERERRQREELERQRLAEEERLRNLETQAELWAKSEQLRAYIRAVEKAASTRPLSNDLKAELDKWVSWAREHADRLDPLKRRLPFDVR